MSPNISGLPSEILWVQGDISLILSRFFHTGPCFLEHMDGVYIMGFLKIM